MQKTIKWPKCHVYLSPVCHIVSFIYLIVYRFPIRPRMCTPNWRCTAYVFLPQISLERNKEIDTPILWMSYFGKLYSRLAQLHISQHQTSLHQIHFQMAERIYWLLFDLIWIWYKHEPFILYRKWNEKNNTFQWKNGYKLIKYNDFLLFYVQLMLFRWNFSN